MSEKVRKAIRIRAVAAPEGVTAQPKDTDQWTPDHARTPPADLDQLAGMTQIARTRRSCIEAVTLNTVGRGVEFEPREGREDEAEDTDARELLEHLDRLARRDTVLGRPSLKRLLSAVKWDEEEVGNGYLEVARSRLSGEICGLFHVPGKEVRRREDRKGWVVGAKGAPTYEQVEFYDFGEKVKYDAEGQPEGLLAKAGMRWDRNELIPFQLYTSESRDYGLPRDAHLSIDYLGDHNAASANVSFFDSSGVPPTIVFLKMAETDGDGVEDPDVEIDPELVTQVANTLSADADRRHRVAFVQLPEGVEPHKIDLATLSERDMGFIEFRKDNRRATHGAFRISPIFTADIEDTNYSTAETERKLTKEQAFDPEQDRWADILNTTIIAEIAPHMRLRFVELDVTDDKAQRESANSLADKKAITYGEYREAHGQPPLPEADEGKEPKPGQVEYGWNGRIVEVVTDGTDAGARRGLEAAAQLIAEGNPAGPTGIESVPVPADG